jgi:DNA-binding NtrC family response regulator
MGIMPRIPVGRRLILVADRSEITRTVLREILVRHGYRVVSAGTTADALKVISRLSSRLDGVIAESTPQAAAGFDLAAEIRHAVPQVPLLAMSNPMLHFASRDTVLPTVNFERIDKPFKQAYLLEKLDRILANESADQHTRCKAASAS